MARRAAIGRWSALAGSLALHGALAVAVVGFVTRGTRERPSSAPRGVAIELTTAPAPRSPPVHNAGPPAESTSQAAALRQARTALGGWIPKPQVASPEVPGAARSLLARAATPPSIAGETTLRMDAANPAGASEVASLRATIPCRLSPVTATDRSKEDVAGRRSRPCSTGLAHGDASGGGIGGEGLRGSGIGLGAGTPFVAPPVPPAPVPPEGDPPPPSRARPARLIYPSRERDAEEAQQLVARLTIDTDGYVVGVHLVRGTGSARDDRGAAAVWRFRYLPALDAAGRPIQVTIEQHFLVE